MRVTTVDYIARHQKTLDQHVGYLYCLCAHLFVCLSQRWILMAECLDSLINVNISSRFLRCISAKNSLVSAAYARTYVTKTEVFKPSLQNIEDCVVRNRPRTATILK